MPERYRRYFLKDKDVKTLLAKASARLKIDLEQVYRGKSSFEVVEAGFAEIFLFDGEPVLVEKGESVYPTLVFERFRVAAPKIVVDMGAVPFICKGANVMAPGIRSFEGEFAKGDLVLIVDEKHGKAIAIGEVLCDSRKAKETKQGVIAKNVHFVSDQTWNFIKNIAGHAEGKVKA